MFKITDFQMLQKHKSASPKYIKKTINTLWHQNTINNLLKIFSYNKIKQQVIILVCLKLLTLEFMQLQLNMDK